MTKYIVEFSSNAEGYRDKFKGTFRSRRVLDKFMDMWQHAGGFLRFNHDVLYELNDEYPGVWVIIPANYRGYKMVMSALYPDLYND